MQWRFLKKSDANAREQLQVQRKEIEVLTLQHKHQDASHRELARQFRATLEPTVNFCMSSKVVFTKSDPSKKLDFHHQYGLTVENLHSMTSASQLEFRITFILPDGSEGQSITFAELSKLTPLESITLDVSRKLVNALTQIGGPQYAKKVRFREGAQSPGSLARRARVSVTFVPCYHGATPQKFSRDYFLYLSLEEQYPNLKSEVARKQRLQKSMS